MFNGTYRYIPIYTVNNSSVISLGTLPLRKEPKNNPKEGRKIREGNYADGIVRRWF